MKAIVIAILLGSCEPGSIVDHRQDRDLLELQRRVNDLRIDLIRMHFCIELRDLGAMELCSHNQVMSEEHP